MGVIISDRAESGCRRVPDAVGGVDCRPRIGRLSRGTASASSRGRLGLQTSTKNPLCLLQLNMHFLYAAHVLDILRAWPPEMFNCVVTSPPYWGLRDYKTEPQVWGGEPACEHEWIDGARSAQRIRHGATGGIHEGRAVDGLTNTLLLNPATGGTCTRCGCWRGHLGGEPDPGMYVGHLVEIFREVRRVLRKDGTLWLNLGDSYANDTKWGGHTGGKHVTQLHGESIGRAKRETGLKAKDLCMIPARVALALQADGWYLRSDIIWAKPNPMPESVQGSHFSRHRVTIKEYERLSGLRYTDERAGDDWAGDMPSLSEREVSSSKAPLSTKREGNSDGAGQRVAGGCSGEAEAIQQVKTRQAQPGEIRSDQQGPKHTEEGVREILQESESKADEFRAASANERPTSATSTKADCKLEIPADRQGQGTFAETECKAERSHPGDGARLNCGGMERNCGTARLPAPLLQNEIEADARSRDTAQQGWAAHEGECSASVRPVQFQEAGQVDPSKLVGCPGCPKCIKHHGYVFHLSAGRPTKSHEYIFLLTKSEKYWYDADAIAEPFATDPKENYPARAKITGRGTQGAADARGNDRDKSGGFPPRKNEQSENRRYSGFNDRWDSGGEDILKSHVGRNKRSVWTIATCPFKGAHFATFPPALVEICLKAGCPPGGTVLDPFIGSGTTVVVAERLGMDAVGIDLNPEYIRMAEARAAAGK